MKAEYQDTVRSPEPELGWHSPPLKKKNTYTHSVSHPQHSGPVEIKCHKIISEPVKTKKSVSSLVGFIYHDIVHFLEHHLRKNETTRQEYIFIEISKKEKKDTKII